MDGKYISWNCKLKNKNKNKLGVATLTPDKTAINKKVSDENRKLWFSKTGNKFMINEAGQKAIKSMFFNENENSKLNRHEYRKAFSRRVHGHFHRYTCGFLGSHLNWGLNLYVLLFLSSTFYQVVWNLRCHLVTELKSCHLIFYQLLQEVYLNGLVSTSLFLFNYHCS